MVFVSRLFYAVNTAICRRASQRDRMQRISIRNFSFFNLVTRASPTGSYACKRGTKTERGIPESVSNL